MNSKKEISDELLNAYVDGELSIDDQAELLEAFKQNPKLSEQVCERRVLKEMLKVSYQQPPTVAQRSQKSERRGFPCSISQCVLASIFLLMMVAAVNLMHSSQSPFGGLSVPELSNSLQMAEQNHNVLLHIGTDNDERIQLALDNAEHLLSSFSDKKQKNQLQILVNAEAIHMLNQEHSPYIERIKQLSHRYQNVAFLACQRAIERQKLKGVDIHLVKEADVVSEALQTVVDRIRDGWVYIRA